MPPEDTAPLNPAPKTPGQLLAEMFRENERLQRQVEDARHERDQYKKLYLSALSHGVTELTPEDLATAVPARPIIEAHIRRLEKK